MIELSFFESRKDAFLTEAAALNKKSRMYASLRITLFMLGIVLAVYFANERNAWAVFFTVIPSTFLFLLVVKVHNRIKYKKAHAEFLAEINQGEINRMEGNLKGFDTGQQFINKDHFYSGDLDIFGQNSLFQLLNRTGTEPGREMLASWLLSPANKPDILARQEAVIELSDQVDWRQQFQASAMHSKNTKTDFDKFGEWINEPSKMTSTVIYGILSYLLPILTLLSIVSEIIYGWPYQITIGILVLNGIILSRWMKLAGETAEKASNSLNAIRAYSKLIEMVEVKSFQSKCLNDLQSPFKAGKVNASVEILILSRIMEKFDSRSNFLFYILDLVFLLDLHWLKEAEAWKTRNRTAVKVWIENISQMEVIASLSGTMHTHDFTMPEISTNKLQMSGGGHPLIVPSERVMNDFEMDGPGSQIIITGSNMSGKSTFLRTVGINLVLALSGGPVCSKKACFPLVNVYTSMRINDSLEEHISSFYAELKRIKGMLDLLEYSEIPVFNLLDEILKGTNSDDRHLGVESLVLQLLPLNCLGIISTHDLSLGSLANKYDKIKNYSFNSTIINHEIIFDYKITGGVCRGFNASKLMEKMGIKLQTNNDRNL